jgi:hypothetical protein
MAKATAQASNIRRRRGWGGLARREWAVRLIGKAGIRELS